MTRPLTLLQRDALIQLAGGHRFGVAGTTAASLRDRGLVTLHWVELGSGGKLRLPWLTEKGAAVARQLRDETIRESHNVVVLERQLRRLPLFQGGAA